MSRHQSGGKEARRAGGAIKKVSDLTPNPDNPRKITDEQLKVLGESLVKFGDLSGLVLNLTTGNLVGGHQRLKVLGDSPITISERFSKPNKQGTVAQGYVSYEGERYVYREVRWDTAMEKAAMLAANKHGGEWDFSGVSKLLSELDASKFDLSITGFSAKEIEKLMLTVEEVVQSDEKVGSSEVLPSHIRMVQLFLTTDSLPKFMEQVKALQERFEMDNITDTVLRSVDMVYNSKHGTAKSPSPPKNSRTRSEVGLPKAARRRAAKA